jgi:hypothetical protein
LATTVCSSVILTYQNIGLLHLNRQYSRLLYFLHLILGYLSFSSGHVLRLSLQWCQHCGGCFPAKFELQGRLIPNICQALEVIDFILVQSSGDFSLPNLAASKKTATTIGGSWGNAMHDPRTRSAVISTGGQTTLLMQVVQLLR